MMEDVGRTPMAPLDHPAAEVEPSPVDCVVHVDITPDRMTLYVTVEPPRFGGKELTEQMLRDALAAAKVTTGIQEAKLRDMAAKRIYNVSLELATGTPPEHGKDGSVEKLFAENRVLAPKKNKDGSVNYRDLGLIENVRAGTVICNITPATQGTAGVDIMGNTVAAMPGRAAHIPAGQNTAFIEGENVLRSTADGNITFRGGMFHIETVFTVQEDVGPSTGNIDFIGEVVVRGDVLEGFSIKAEKGITVRGMVKGATLESNGSILLRQGIGNSIVTTKEKFQCQFAEVCTITSGKDVVAGALVNCTVVSGGNIVVESSPGTIMGGKYTSMRNISASCIGARSYIATTLIVGSRAIASAERLNLEKQVAQLNQNLLQASQAVTYLQEKKKRDGKLPGEQEELLINALRLKVQLDMDKAPMLERIKEINEYMDEKQNLFVQFRRTLYPGVRITIGDYSYSVPTEQERGKLVIGQDNVELRQI